jgi:type II secretory ATPase GspE/PulE/Tfp pilus assembly ATPase PilB-like protein
VVGYGKELHDKIVFRIKIMARMRTDEHAAAQDGRFTHKISNSSFDVRVSAVPVTNGENVVMRLLTERVEHASIDDLGFLPEDLKKIREATLKSYGMILAVGPTGSGKTTTLYGILRTLNKPEVNIMTIEDPVEYDIEHVQQIQVNPKKELTFANGLRSLVRQDPNIIMVGEIRDKETAAIAVNAAMTGHLLLSTLHANDAATTFPRLIEMGVEPFLVASSVNIVIARRLVRKICERCRATYALTEKELAALREEPELLAYIKQAAKKDDLSQIVLHRGNGCSSCDHTGYSGRIGISEVLKVTDEIRPLIVQKSHSDIIKKKAMESGMTTILYDGAARIVQGITTIEEVIRVTKA